MTHKRPTEFDQKLGERVRNYRLKQGLNQKDLAHNLQISFQQVQKYEKGDNRISSERLCKLAQALHVPVERLVDKLYDAEAQSVSLSAAEQQLLAQFDAISTPSTRKLVVQLVELLSYDPPPKAARAP